MGYSHYYTANLSETSYAKVEKDVKKIEKAMNLYDGRGEKKGVAYFGNSLMFNGDASKDEDHETLSLSVGNEWEFCKTARKPYDAAVVVTLLCLLFHNSKAEISSDGDFEDDEWQYGLNLFHQLFPKRKNVKFAFGSNYLTIEK